MNTNEFASEELKNSINELRDSLFGGLKNSLEGLRALKKSH